MRKSSSSLFLLLLCITIVTAGGIREFDVPTLERLGNELARRDEIAARASDAVLDTQPAARALKLRGWVSELSKDGDKVYLTTEVPSGPVLAYRVVFHDDKPMVEDHRGESLPPAIALRFKARNTAASAVEDKLYKDANYNFEVLDDPDGRGFLVYALAATRKKGELLTGGHFRITVSPDGAKADRVDPLGQLTGQAAPPDEMKAIVSTPDEYR